jgi:hypothetical protein
MNPTRAGLARLLARAAELRAGGTSWEQVALTLGRSVATCRGWPHKYADLWRRVYATAVRERLAAGGAEALFVLREMLRSEDEKTRQAAARILASLLERTTRTDHAGEEAETDPALEVVKDLTDDKLLDLLDSVRAIVATGPRPKALD